MFCSLMKIKCTLGWWTRISNWIAHASLTKQIMLCSIDISCLNRGKILLAYFSPRKSVLPRPAWLASKTPSHKVTSHELGGHLPSIKKHTTVAPCHLPIHYKSSMCVPMPSKIQSEFKLAVSPLKLRTHPYIPHIDIKVHCIYIIMYILYD